MIIPVSVHNAATDTLTASLDFVVEEREYTGAVLRTAYTDVTPITVSAGITYTNSYTIPYETFGHGGEYVAMGVVSGTVAGENVLALDVVGFAIAGLPVTLSYPSTVGPDQTFDVTLTAQNVLSSPITDFVVTGDPPDYFRVSGSTVVTVPTFAPASTVTATWALSTSLPGVHVIGFSTFADEVGRDTTYATITVTEPVRLWLPSHTVVVTSTGSDVPVTPLTVTLENLGDEAASDVHLQLSPPQNVTTTQTSWDLGTLQAGGAITVSTLVTIGLYSDFTVGITATDGAGHGAVGSALFKVILDPAPGSPASLTASYSDIGVDTDSDGKYNYLRISAGVNVTDTGSYLVEGYLDDGNGDLVVRASDLVSLSVGVQSVDLDFDGTAIYRYGVDGPYHLALVEIYDDEGRLADYARDAYTTTAYAYTDFQSE